jgi:hypothetical protein
LGSLFLTTGDTSFIISTIIDGDSSGTVITNRYANDSTTIIIGFTIRNGFAPYGGGILVDPSSSPLIRNNRIIGNYAGTSGAGIESNGYSVIITDNLIGRNAILS